MLEEVKRIRFCSNESDLRLPHNDLAGPNGYHYLILKTAVAGSSEKSVILAFQQSVISRKHQNFLI
jgi:hypothetical protein